MDDSAPWKTEETTIGLSHLPVLSGSSRFGGCHVSVTQLRERGGSDQRVAELVLEQEFDDGVGEFVGASGARALRDQAWQAGAVVERLPESSGDMRVPGTPESSGDTIPNRLGEFRGIRESNERIDIAAYGHPAGRPGATGVERPGHERMANGWAAASGEKRFELSETIAWFGEILNIDGPLVEIGFRSVLNNSAIGARQGSFGHALATGKDR